MEPLPKPRSKELTSLELEKLKKLPQYLRLTPSEFVLYNLVEKESNSGLFKNERLLVFNARQESICYLSKVPPGLIPFETEEEVALQQPKEKLSLSEIYENGENKATVRAIPEKYGIEIKMSRSDRKIDWVYYFFARELMEEWYSHLHFLFTRTRQEIDQKYHPKVLDQSPKQPQEELLPSPAKEVSLNNSPIQSKKPQQSSPNKTPEEELEEIKPNDEKQSEFNQFSENSPLGKFVREDRKYNTYSLNEPRSQGTIYNSSPMSENKGYIRHEPFKAKREEEELPSISNDQKSFSQGSKASLASNGRAILQPRLQTDWNLLYYSGKDLKSKIYFDFLNECIKYTTELVDRLPMTKQIEQFQSINSFYFSSSNGIVYKIAFAKEESSLIYELSEDNPIVRDSFEANDDLKEQFFEERQGFFKTKEDSPPLVCFIDYKGLSFLCKASISERLQTSRTGSFKRSNVNEDLLLKKLENLQLFIVSTSDLQDIMRYLNASTLNLSYLYLQTNIKSFKIHFLNEMFSEVFLNIVRGELCHLYSTFRFEQFQSLQVVGEAVNDSILMLVNRLFGKGRESDHLWEIVFAEVQRKYKVVPSKESILPGYLLYSIIYKLGMELPQSINMKNTFILFKKAKTIEREHITGFKPRVYCLNYEQMSQLFQQIKDNLQSPQENNDELEMLVSNEEYEQIPPLVNHLAPKISIQLSKTKPYSSDGEHILVYQSLLSDIPTENSYEIVLSAISWLLQAEKQSEAYNLTFIKIEQLIFWSGKIPLISLFYQSFAEYYLSHNQNEKGIEQIKFSLKNLAEIFGPQSSKLLPKKHELCEHYLALNRREDSLRELYECKAICESNQYESSSLYIQILTKIARLNLVGGKFNESISCSMVCLKHLQAKVEDEQVFESQAAACEFLEIGELLLRAFQLTNRRQELFQVISLCAQRCQNVDSIKAAKRLLRIALFPYLKRLSLKESQVYLLTVQELNAAYKQSSFREQQLYNCIKERRILVQLNAKLKNSFKHLAKFYEEIAKKKLFQEFSGEEDEYFLRKDRSEVEQFLRETFLITNLIGIGFIQGMLKDVYYD